jgi:hypothetical protein
MSLCLVVYISDIGSDDQSKYNTFKYDLEGRVYPGREKPGFIDQYPYVRLDELVPETKKKKFLSAYFVDEANADDLSQFLREKGEAEVAQVPGISFDSLLLETRKSAILRWFKRCRVQRILEDEVTLSYALQQLAKETLSELTPADQVALKNKIAELLRIVTTIKASDSSWTGGEITNEIDSNKHVRIISEWLSKQ